MLDAENDYFSTLMARPYGYVAPRLVSRIFQSPRGNLEIALKGFAKCLKFDALTPPESRPSGSQALPTCLW